MLGLVLWISLDARVVSFDNYDYPMDAGADSRDAGGDCMILCEIA
jgi:hypothetical protein